MVTSAACCRGYTENESLSGPASVCTPGTNALPIGFETMSNSTKKYMYFLFFPTLRLAYRYCVMGILVAPYLFKL